MNVFILIILLFFSEELDFFFFFLDDAADSCLDVVGFGLTLAAAGISEYGGWKLYMWDYHYLQFPWFQTSILHFRG